MPFQTASTLKHKRSASLKKNSLNSATSGWEFGSSGGRKGRWSPASSSQRESGPGRVSALPWVTQLSHTSLSSCRKGGSENQQHVCPSRRACEPLRGAPPGWRRTSLRALGQLPHTLYSQITGGSRAQRPAQGSDSGQPLKERKTEDGYRQQTQVTVRRNPQTRLTPTPVPAIAGTVG